MRIIENSDVARNSELLTVAEFPKTRYQTVQTGLATGYQSYKLLEPPFNAADESVKGNRLLELFELAGLNSGDIGPGGEAIEPSGNLVARKYPEGSALALPADA